LLWLFWLWGTGFAQIKPVVSLCKSLPVIQAAKHKQRTWLLRPGPSAVVMAIILALRKLRQEICEFKTSLSNTARPCLNEPKPNQGNKNLSPLRMYLVLQHIQLNTPCIFFPCWTGSHLSEFQCLWNKPCSSIYRELSCENLEFYSSQC
jgi:hypothetical protein